MLPAACLVLLLSTPARAEGPVAPIVVFAHPTLETLDGDQAKEVASLRAMRTSSRERFGVLVFAGADEALATAFVAYLKDPKRSTARDAFGAPDDVKMTLGPRFVRQAEISHSPADTSGLVLLSDRYQPIVLRQWTDVGGPCATEDLACLAGHSCPSCSDEEQLGVRRFVLPDSQTAYRYLPVAADDLRPALAGFFRSHGFAAPTYVDGGGLLTRQAGADLRWKGTVGSMGLVDLVLAPGDCPLTAFEGVDTLPIDAVWSTETTLYFGVHLTLGASNWEAGGAHCSAQVGPEEVPRWLAVAKKDLEGEGPARAVSISLQERMTPMEGRF